MKKCSQLLTKIKKHKILFSISLIFLYSSIDNRTYNKFIPKYFRLKNCQKLLHERFNFSGKLKYDYLNKESFSKKPNYELNKVYPTNIFDTQKLLKIATDLNIPIINEFSYSNSEFDLNVSDNLMNNNVTNDTEKIQKDSNNKKSLVNDEIKYINFDHIKVDFSKFNKILKFDKAKNIISIEPGVKIKDLLEYLSSYKLTIKELEFYKYTELTISDIIYNNYYSFIDGNFIDEKIEEITVIVPNKQEALKLKQANDIILSCANLKNIFLRSNSIFGLINEFKLKTEPQKEYFYLALENFNITFEECVHFIKDLEELKTGKLAKEFIMSNSGNLINVFIKSKDKKIERIKKFFEKQNLKIKKLTHDDFLEYRNNKFGVINKDEKIFRKLKLRLDKNIIIDAMTKILKLAKEYKTQISYHFDLNHDCVEINVYSDDDLYSIENSIFLIQRIINFADKNTGNMFSNFFSF